MLASLVFGSLMLYYYRKKANIKIWIYIFNFFCSLPNFLLSKSQISNYRMTVSNVDIIRWFIVFTLCFFHCLVTCFVLLMRHRKNNVYNSNFFLLYLMFSFADIATIFNTFLISKLVLVESLKPWFYNHPIYNTVLWLISGYLVYFQSILHAAIAINRTWVAFRTTNFDSKIAKYGRKVIWSLPFFPILILSVRFSGTSVYFYSPAGELAGTYVEPLVKSVSHFE